MHGYLGLTCHYVSDEWEMKTRLLCCKRMIGRHTGENIQMEYDSVLDDYGIAEKVFKAVTDNASNMRKAFSLVPEDSEELSENEDDSDECFDLDEEEEEEDGTIEFDCDLPLVKAYYMMTKESAALICTYFAISC